MKKKILFVERNFWVNAGIEKVFRQIAKGISGKMFEVEFQTVKYRSGIGALIKNLLFFKKKQADIYHITGDIHYIALLLPKNRTILTVHDLIFLQNRSKVRRFVLKKLFLDIPIKRLKYITAISQATKDEIIAETGCSNEKIRVIENPIFDSFQNRTLEKKTFNKDCPLILHIGTAINKNIENLIEAVKDIKCRLRIIGKLEPKLLDIISKYDINFENEFGLDEEQIVQEYIKADILSFCSVYEGFGLPIIEAQALKTVVVTSDISPLKEVAGGGACLVNPYDYKSIRLGFLKVLREKSYRKALVKKGLVNIKRYSSADVSKKYLKLYHEVAGGLGKVNKLH